MQRKKLLALILAFSAVIGTVCVTGCSKNSGTVDTNKQPKVNVLNCIDEVFTQSPENVEIRFMNNLVEETDVRPILLAEVGRTVSDDDSKTTLYNFVKSTNITYYDVEKYQFSKFPGISMMLDKVKYGIDFEDGQENSVKVNINTDGKLYIKINTTDGKTQYYNGNLPQSDMQVFSEYFIELANTLF